MIVQPGAAAHEADDVPQLARRPVGVRDAGVSIAVRPFMVLSEDRGLEFLANGLAEDVIALLARVPGFFLIERALRSLSNPDVPTSVIAGQLGVRYVLEGSVRSNGDRVRVSTQLVEAAAGRILWSGKFEAPRAETPELQDDIARGIIIELEPALTQAEVGTSSAVSVRKMWMRGAASIRLTERARRRRLERNAPFWRHRVSCGGRSSSTPTSPLRARIAAFFWRSRKPPDSSSGTPSGPKRRPRQQKMRSRPMPAVPRSWATPGARFRNYLGQVERGAEILRQAVEMDPSNAQAEVALGAALALLGDLDSGIAHMRRGIKLRPRDRRLAFWGWLLGTFLLRANRAEEALEEARIAARRDPLLHLPPILEAAVHATAGQPELVQVALAAAKRLRPALTLREVEVSHGRHAAQILSEYWDAGSALPAQAEAERPEPNDRRR